MRGIICAVRGGLESRATITQAIGLAQTTELSVHFLYVVNQELMLLTGSELARSDANQLRQMGESVLSAAQDLASLKGVITLRSARQGNIEEEIASACSELDAKYLVIGHRGRPRGACRSPISAQFAVRLGEQVGTRIIRSES